MYFIITFKNEQYFETHFFFFTAYLEHYAKCLLIDSVSMPEHKTYVSQQDECILWN